MKELIVILFCTWKFAATFPVAICIMKMSTSETLIYTNIGGVIGAFLFLHFSGFLIKVWNRNARGYFQARNKNKKVFTTEARRFVRIKSRYGLAGIVILNPVILSIPVGAFLAARYYGTGKRVFGCLIAGQVFWSLIYTLVYTQLRDLIF